MKKASIILAIVVSLFAIYQGSISMIDRASAYTSTFAKLDDLKKLSIDVKLNTLKRDVDYLQNKIWELEDRYGYIKLRNKDASIPNDVIHRYHEYITQLDEKTSTIKILMQKRIGGVGSTVKN